MMENRPTKFRFLELFHENKTMWSYDAVKQLQSEYKMEDNYGRDSLNYDLIELAAAGFLKSVDGSIDEEGSFRKGALLTKYNITALGENQFEELCKNIRHKEDR